MSAHPAGADKPPPLQPSATEDRVSVEGDHRGPPKTDSGELLAHLALQEGIRNLAMIAAQAGCNTPNSGC